MEQTYLALQDHVLSQLGHPGACPCSVLPQEPRAAVPLLWPRSGRARRECGQPLLPLTIIPRKNESAVGGAAQEEILSLSPPLRRCHVLGTDWELPFLLSLSCSETRAVLLLPLRFGL